MNEPPKSDLAQTEQLPSVAAVSAAESASGSQSQSWGLSTGDRRFLLVVGLATLAITFAHVVRSWWTAAPLIEVRRLESRRAEFQIDINQATWVEWMQLPGIGETMARQIVDDRQTRGPFASVDDVSRVKGIGPARMTEMRPFLKHDSNSAQLQPVGP